MNMKRRIKREGTRFRIKDTSTGTYYAGMTGIGPRFGATREQAETFDDGMVALRVIDSFPIWILAILVNERGTPCTITGYPIRSRKRRAGGVG